MTVTRTAFVVDRSSPLVAAALPPGADPQAALDAMVAAGGPPGRTFTIPSLIREGVRTHDGRRMRGITARTGPTTLPLMARWTTHDGHDGATLVGRINQISPPESGSTDWSATGVMDTSPAAREAVRLHDELGLNGISADGAADRVDFVRDDDGRETREFPNYHIVGATMSPMQAFDATHIVIHPADDGMPSATGILAAGVATPPREWFADPSFTTDTTVEIPGFPGKRGAPLTITADGRVAGHIAVWGVPHTGLNGRCAPHSETGYRWYMNKGPVLCADSTQVAVGVLTVGKGHAGLEWANARAVEHYDDVTCRVADVVVGEDEFGIWCAGRIAPGTTDEQVDRLRASGPSGDWRWMGDRGHESLEMIGVLAVNVQGFPIPRLTADGKLYELPQVTPAVVEDGEQVLAMVAAGAPWIAHVPTGSETDAGLKAVRLLASQFATESADRARTARDARIAKARAGLRP